jgi:hypothetical protein
MLDRRPCRELVPVSMVLLLVAVAVRAEVSTDPTPGGVNTLTMGIVDDSDPISVMWQPFRSIPPERILNASGHARGDGRPDLAFKAITDDPEPVPGWPVVVWAYDAGADHDIAIAEWVGAEWGPIEFLTAGVDDDLDPRVFIEDDGTTHVVWWTDGVADKVFLLTRSPASPSWNDLLEVTAAGRRPSVAVFGGELRVAFERDSTVQGMAQDVVILRREIAGTFSEEFATSTSRTQPLDAVLHTRAGKLWVDWKQGYQVFGCAKHELGAWGPVEQPVWPDPTWIGVEETRRVIEGQVLD